jgi:hypothetical protein
MIRNAPLLNESVPIPKADLETTYLNSIMLRCPIDDKKMTTRPKPPIEMRQQRFRIINVMKSHADDYGVKAGEVLSRHLGVWRPDVTLDCTDHIW